MVPLLLLLLALAVLAVVAVLAAGRGGSLEEAAPDLGPTGLPGDGPLTADDLELVRLPVAFRGYRMDSVDSVLDRVAAELTARDERIAALEARERAGTPPPPDADGEAGAPGAPDPARPRDVPGAGDR